MKMKDYFPVMSITRAGVLTLSLYKCSFMNQNYIASDSFPKNRKKQKWSETHFLTHLL